MCVCRGGEEEEEINKWAGTYITEVGRLIIGSSTSPAHSVNYSGLRWMQIGT